MSDHFQSCSSCGLLVRLTKFNRCACVKTNRQFKCQYKVSAFYYKKVTLLSPVATVLRDQLFLYLQILLVKSAVRGFEFLLLRLPIMAYCYKHILFHYFERFLRLAGVSVLIRYLMSCVAERRKGGSAATRRI